MNGRVTPKHIGRFPLADLQQAKGNCLLTSYFILSPMNEAEFVYRKRFEAEWSRRSSFVGQSTEEADFRKAVDAHPSILIVETGATDKLNEPIDHAIAYVNGMTIDPMGGTVVQESIDGFEQRRMIGLQDILSKIREAKSSNRSAWQGYSRKDIERILQQGGVVLGALILLKMDNEECRQKVTELLA